MQYLAHSENEKSDLFAEDGHFHKLISVSNSNTCLAAIIADKPSVVHTNCKFHVYLDKKESNIHVLDYPLVLLHHVYDAILACPEGRQPIASCEFCMIELRSTCSLNTEMFVIPPKLLNGNVNNGTSSKIKYPINLPLLSKFFTEEELSGLSGGSPLDYKLGIRLPDMKFFNNSFAQKLAVDQTIKYDMEKLAVAVKTDQHIFSSLVEPVVTGDIFLPDSFFYLCPRHSVDIHCVSLTNITCYFVNCFVQAENSTSSVSCVK